MTNHQHHYPGPTTAIELFRTFLKHLLWMSGYDYHSGAIAVNHPKTAAFLRNVLGFRGPIIDLASLQYQGYNGFPAGFMMHFAECGHSAHVRTHILDQPWLPTLIKRPDGSRGYLKCTFRSVQIMRYWMEYFYPILVVQQGLYKPDGTYQAVAHDMWFLQYMDKRLRSLAEDFPGVNWRTDFAPEEERPRAGPRLEMRPPEDN